MVCLPRHLLVRTSLIIAISSACWDQLPLKAAEQIPLWTGPAPTAPGGSAEVQPFLEVFPVASARANGAAFVICPGGGYGGLAADHEGTQVARWANGLGVAAFVLHYRLGPQGHHYPTQLIDVQRAVRLIRSRAPALGIDPHRIGIIGFSAGGHLASMAATLFNERPRLPGQVEDAVDAVSGRPDVAVLGYPVIALHSPHTHRGSRKNLLGPADADPLAETLSTDSRVTADTPPTFLFQTDEDTAVPADNAIAFYLACRRHRVPAELHVYERGPHGVGLALGNPVLGRWTDLLRDWLRDRAFLRPAARVGLKGTATVNGTPVSWGMVTFTPDDPDLPVACGRVRNGRFVIDGSQGPPQGQVTVTLRASAVDLPTATSLDGTVAVTERTPGSGPWRLTISPNQPELILEASN